VIVSINQPAYLPWLGYFHRIAVSDVHVVLDHVQFEKNSFVNRNRIRTPQGSMLLTVPVQTSGRFGALPINEIEIAATPAWARKHRESLRANYARAAHFAEHEAFFRDVYARDWKRLLPLLDHTTDYLLRSLGIGTRLVRSAGLGVPSRKSDLVVDICERLGATVYFSGALGRRYLDKDAFRRKDIRVIYQDYEHPTYSQVFDGFESNLSVVDLLMAHGPASLEILMNGNVNRSTLMAATQP